MFSFMQFVEQMVTELIKLIFHSILKIILK